MAPRVLAVVQARLGSTRLPGKALAPIGGRPMLFHVIVRTLAVPGVDQTVLATTVNPEDDALVQVATSLGVTAVRGSVDDVLDRFHAALRAHPADAIVRITADCPLLDPAVSGLVVADYLAHRDDADYVSNVEPPTYPDGLDTEIVSAGALDRACREARLPSDREHVTTYIRNRAHRFRIRNVVHESDLSSLRFTVDEPRDLTFVRAVYDELAPEGHRLFGMCEVFDLLRARPDLATLNAGIGRNEGLLRSMGLDGAATKAADGGAHE
jgi:spore coat polysaccharide biosynthesis protein SpsF (cytidylyltransferase family)